MAFTSGEDIEGLLPDGAQGNGYVLIVDAGQTLKLRTLGNISVSDKEFSDKDRALSSSHLGVVGDQNILDAVFQDVVLPDSPNYGSHAILGIAIEPRLRSERVLVHDYHVPGS